MADLPTSAPEYLVARERAKASARWLRAIALAAALACILLAATLVAPLNGFRRHGQMRLNTDVKMEVPPDIALLNTMLGPFRGAWIASLWIQAEDLKEQGRFYDALQRAEWICKLQPRLQSVWGFQAWNMAYNISVTKHTIEERWRWINNALHLLQEQGIPLNPREIGLYKELSWIYFHKIGDILDDMQWEYKCLLAAEFEQLLGVPDLSLSDQETIDAFRAIAEAPTTLLELRQGAPEVEEFLGRLRNIGYEPDFEMLKAHHRAYVIDNHIAKRTENQATITDQQQALLDLCNDPKLSDAARRVIACVRGKVLRDDYGLEPKRMMEFLERFGPLDWRLPWTHAAYWGWIGDERTKDVITRRPSLVVNNHRVIMFSMMNLYERGRLLFAINLDEPAKSDFYLASNPSLIDYVQNNFLEYGKLYGGGEKDTAGISLAQTHRKVLNDAIKQYYIRSAVDPTALKKARELYDYTKNAYRNQDDTIKARYGATLEDYIERLFQEDADTQMRTVNLIGEFTRNGLQALAIGKDGVFQAYMDNARLAYDRHLKGKETYKTNRGKLPSFDRLMGQMIFLALVAEPMPTYYKSRIWKFFLNGSEAQSDLVRMIFDQSRSYLSAECKAGGYDVDLFFPEPSGMTEYRAANVGVDPFPEPYVPVKPTQIMNKNFKAPEVVVNPDIEK